MLGGKIHKQYEYNRISLLFISIHAYALITSKSQYS